MSEFEISVIIPVYNAESYLEETLQSVVKQSLGIEKIQIVLVDDGSSDGSADVCMRFASQHPNNTIFIQQENSGVSAARNRGLEAATGRFVTFLDSDDMWSSTSFKEAIGFFSEHPEIDLVCGQLMLFGKSKSNHPLSYKYRKGGVIDLTKNPCDIQSTIGNCFFRRAELGDLRFVTEYSTSEDTLLINHFLLKRKAYGVTSKCTYYYRKRLDGSSLSQKRSVKKHMQNLDVCKSLFEASVSETGSVQPYIQAAALYIINWQIFGEVDQPFSLEESEQWKTRVSKLANSIDNEVICTARWMSRACKLYTLKLKHGDDIVRRVSWENQENAVLNGIVAFSLNAASPCYIYETKAKNGFLHLEGTTDLDNLGTPFAIYAKGTSGARYEAALVKFPTKDMATMSGDHFCLGYRFELNLPLIPGETYSLHLALPAACDSELQLTPHFNLFAKFDQTKKRNYCVFGNTIVRHENKQIVMTSYSKAKHFSYEIKKIAEVLSDRRFKFASRVKFAGLRVLYHLSRFKQNKPIWIFTDKEWKAGDNAENVYRYAMKQSGYQDADMWFALEKTSSDYPSVSSYGKVLEPSSGKYKLYFLLASKVISSRAEAALINPYSKRAALIKDLLSYDLIYLTHGTLFGDLSEMLSKPSKMIRLFSASTQMEGKALLGSEYAYSDDEVKVLGMARYDAYGNAQRKKVVAFLPTWRANIAGPVIPGTSTREYVPDFQTSEYCTFFNQLINNEKLLSALKKNGYTGEFYVHPAFEKQAPDFRGNDLIVVGERSADYERVLSESSLLVTDYSGVGFDFGYQRKPLVYCHFDSVFGNSHTYGEKSYFDYETDGFGPVTRSLEDTVEAIISYIDNDCRVEEKYLCRADDMFGYSDYNNCQRIFDAVVALD